MNYITHLIILSIPLCLLTNQSWGHGPGAHGNHGPNLNNIEATVDVTETGIPVNDKKGKPWTAEITTGWESRHVHYGVNESGNSGVYVNEVGFSYGDLSVNVWNGFGIGNEFLEWDFTAAYTMNVGSVFIIPGYNFKYFPSEGSTHNHSEGHEGEEHEEEEHEGENYDEHEDHAHSLYNNELFLSVGTTAIPYVTPSANFVWNLNNTPGAFLELRVDGDIPVYKDKVRLNPYALYGLNFGYNTEEVYGPNNFQFGTIASVKITENLSAFTGVNYSVALEALEAIDQNNIFWINVGLNYSF